MTSIVHFNLIEMCKPVWGETDCGGLWCLQVFGESPNIGERRVQYDFAELVYLRGKHSICIINIADSFYNLWDPSLAQIWLDVKDRLVLVSRLDMNLNEKNMLEPIWRMIEKHKQLKWWFTVGQMWEDGFAPDQLAGYCVLNLNPRGWREQRRPPVFSVAVPIIENSRLQGPTH